MVLEDKLKLRITFLLSVFFLAAGITLMVVGIFNNEPSDIMNKAIFICLECIGIG